MVLLSRVLDHQPDRTVCAVEIDEQTLFRDSAGNVAAWVGIEYMAQCVAAHGGLRHRAVGEPPRVGFLLGSRRLVFHVPRFRPGQTLEAAVHRVWGREGNMSSFDCTLKDGATGALLAEGRLNCLTPEPGDGAGAQW
jgi:predicted hotdog family 3-hydroxylacyl-ACP dehydratase